MSDTKTRRTIALFDGAKEDLERIKDGTGLSTDNAAINDAVKFRARLARWNPEQLIMAASIYDQLRTAVESGKSVVIENPETPNLKLQLLVPALG